MIKKILLFLLFITLMISIADAQQFLWRYRTHATDCTSLTNGKVTDLCYEQDSQTLYKCVPVSGDCDTASEWVQTSSSGSSTSLDISAADTGNIEIGGYYTLPTTGSTWGTGGTSEMHFLSPFYKSRIRQDGTLTKVSFYVDTKPAALTAFYIEVWRYDTSSEKYDRISQENILSSMTAGSVNTITLATPVTVKEGDTIGYGYTSSGNPGNFLAKSDSGTSSFNRQPNATYYTTGAVTADDFDWSATTSSTDYMGIKLYSGTAPIMVFLGDSTWSGFDVTNSFLTKSIYTTYANPNGVETMAQRVGRALGYTFQNMSIGGETTAQIAARITTDMTNLKPRVMLYAASGNDGQAAQDNATFTTNLDTILDACINIGCIPIVQRYLPVGSNLLNNSKMQVLDAYDAIITTECAARASCIVVDAKPYVGKFRTGGTANNLWEWQDRYSNDRIHPNDEGFEKVADAIIRGIISYTIKGGLDVGSIRLRQDITFGNDSTFGNPGFKSINAEKVVGYEKPGVGIRLKGGEPSLSSTNENGGPVILQAGDSTGTGTSNIQFLTASSGVTGTDDYLSDEKMRLTGAGSLGIGTSAPTARLSARSYVISPVYNFTGHNLTDVTVGGSFTATASLNYLLKIDGTGTPDTFKWSTDGGSTWTASTVSMTGSAQTLNNGVTVTWAATTGHTVDDEFRFHVDVQNPLKITDGLGNTALLIDASGNVGIGNTLPNAKKLVISGDLAIDSVESPSATPVSLAVNATSGNLNGTYRYRMSFGLADRTLQFSGATQVPETIWGPVSSTVSPANQQVDVSAIQVSTDPRVTRRLLFRTKAGGSTYYYLTTINDNTTTTYTDNIADSSLTILRDDSEDTTGTTLGYYETGNYSSLSKFFVRLFHSGRNTAIGPGSLIHLNGGYYNSSNSRNSCTDVSDGDKNTCIGYASLAGNPSEFTALGYQAGLSSWGAGKNMSLGSNSDIGEAKPTSSIAGSATTGSNLTAGTYYYRVTFTLDGVETHLSRARPTAGVVVSGGNLAINLTTIPTYSGGQTCTARTLYRTKAITDTTTNFSAEGAHYYTLATISDNTTTTYSDTTADASLGAEATGIQGAFAMTNDSKPQYSNQVIFGSSSTSTGINRFSIGQGMYNATATDVIMDTTNGSGSNKVGGSWQYYAGRATGNALGGGFHWWTSDTGSSGSALQTLTEKLTLTNTGKVGIGNTSPAGPLNVSTTTVETVTAASTITANACGGFKAISSAGAVTTNTTNTFTAPAASNNGCTMYVCNVGSNNITLDNNASFKSFGAGDVVMTADDCLIVSQYNNSLWYQVTPLEAN